MKKFYSIVLMATMLLVGTNAWAANVAKIGNTEYASLEKAWRAVQNNEVITLLDDATLDSTLWLGTATMEDLNPKSITLDLAGHAIMTSAGSKLSRMFFITHGELNVVGPGTIQMADSSADSQWEVFLAFEHWSRCKLERKS